jgi:hypothetical protein
MQCNQTRSLATCDTLKGCYLVNIKTRNETLLNVNDSYTIDPNNDCGYSIRCDVNGIDELNFLKFKYNNSHYDAFGFPRFMYGCAEQGEYINKVDFLSTCGRKILTVEGHVWANICFNITYTIDALNHPVKVVIVLQLVRLLTYQLALQSKVQYIIMSFRQLWLQSKHLLSLP